uniref:Uncharacterized protein n=1 Tax=Lepeophtheirus salmonis TaxID=72036 RepID=A0A0K2V898_LEPSM
MLWCWRNVVLSSPKKRKTKFTLHKYGIRVFWKVMNSQNIFIYSHAFLAARILCIVEKMFLCYVLMNFIYGSVRLIRWGSIP